MGTEIGTALPRFQDYLAVFAGDLRSHAFDHKIDAARYFGFHHSTITRYEDGEIKPQLGYLAALALLIDGQTRSDPNASASRQHVLLREINRAIARAYGDEPGFADWEALAECAEAFLAARRSSRRSTQHKALIDWGEAPDIPRLYGRTAEQARVLAWLRSDRCRMVGILGIGGIGKTALVTALARELQADVDAVVWRSLRNAPPIDELLDDLITTVLRKPRHAAHHGPEGQIAALLQMLKHQRILLILDNLESLMETGAGAGHFLPKARHYEQLLQAMGETRHQSCVILTSREKPAIVARLEGATRPVRTFDLRGLSAENGEHLLLEKGVLGSTETLARLVRRFDGNPLALQIIAETVREVYAGDVAGYLQAGTPFHSDIVGVLAQQLSRLSATELYVMLWLAVEREPVSLETLRRRLASPLPIEELETTLTSLRRRSLIEQGPPGFSLQSFVLEYVTHLLVATMHQEIVTGNLSRIHSHGLVLAQAKEYVRDSQRRLILAPLTEQLAAEPGASDTAVARLMSLVQAMQAKPPAAGYGASNVINLLASLNESLQQKDFSRLPVWQADLRLLDLQDASFERSHFKDTIFWDTFDIVRAVAVHPDGQQIAAGSIDGNIYLWHLNSSAMMQVLSGHSDWVRSVAFDTRGQRLASASDDATIRLWDVNTGETLRLLAGHQNRVRMVRFHPRGGLLASCGDDRTIRLWDPSTGQCVKIHEYHDFTVSSIEFSPDGRYLASGSTSVVILDVENNIVQPLEHPGVQVWPVAFDPGGNLLAGGGVDGTVFLWSRATGRIVSSLEAADSSILWSIKFCSDGSLLAGASNRGDIWLWEVETGALKHNLRGHDHSVLSLDADQAGDILISGGADRTVRIWDVKARRMIRTIQGYRNGHCTLAFSPDGRMLASGSDDGVVRLWPTDCENQPRSLEGHRLRVNSVAFGYAGALLASASDDGLVRLWDLETGTCRARLQGHDGPVQSVAINSTHGIVGSAGSDSTVRIWNASTGQLLKTLDNHASLVRSIAFSPDNRHFATGSEDRAVKLWTVDGQCVASLVDHQSWVWCVAFSPDGRWLASCGADNKVRVFDAKNGRCVKVIQGHENLVRSAAFSVDGKLLATAGADQSIRLVDLSTDQTRVWHEAHDRRIWSVSFHPNKRWLASAGEDEVIKIWDVETGECVRRHRIDHPYERVRMTGATGLTSAQRLSLQSLGAIM